MALAIEISYPYFWCRNNHLSILESRAPQSPDAHMHLALARRALPRSLGLRRPLHDLIGPPDPVSNVRKVVYDRTEAGKALHPYSLNEFPADTNLTDPDGGRARLDLEWNIARGRLDAFNHHFWADNNARFHEEKAAALEAVPEPRTPEAVQAALDAFYRDWSNAEYERQRIYDRSWHRANRHLLMLALRKRYDIINKAYGRFWRPAEDTTPSMVYPTAEEARKSQRTSEITY